MISQHYQFCGWLEVSLREDNGWERKAILLHTGCYSSCHLAIVANLGKLQCWSITDRTGPRLNYSLTWETGRVEAERRASRCICDTQAASRGAELGNSKVVWHGKTWMMAGPISNSLA